MTLRWMLLPLALIAVAAHAEDRDLCPNRPGLNTPACTVESGRLVAEIGAADWTRDDQGPVRTDTVLLGDTLLRLGIGDATELELGWTPYGHVRARDRSTRSVARQSGVGDVTVAIKQNLRNPDGSGFAVALLPYASLPTGGQAIGAGAWGAGLLLPVSYEVTDAISLMLTPEIDATPDGDRHGRHLSFGSAAGVQAAFSDQLSGSAEVLLIRDHDPDGHQTQALAGLSLAWQPGDDLQFDIGSNLGLNRNSPDAEFYLGVARRF